MGKMAKICTLGQGQDPGSVYCSKIFFLQSTYNFGTKMITRERAIYLQYIVKGRLRAPDKVTNNLQQANP